jgi:REP-associated tyrosine transposase
MPSRNTLKIQIPDAYYHVYARGGNKMKIFLDSNDYKKFISLLERYLSGKASKSKVGDLYPTYSRGLSLHAFCLMRNHFHLLVYQHEVPALEKFMRSLMTSYSKYFNLKYKRTGHVFESRYKAAHIDNQTYLDHISRYIHLNPRFWEGHRYSSYRFYRDDTAPTWLNTESIIAMFNSRDEYIEFHKEYLSHKEILDDIKHHLADR